MRREGFVLLVMAMGCTQTGGWKGPPLLLDDADESADVLAEEADPSQDEGDGRDLAAEATIDPGPGFDAPEGKDPGGTDTAADPASEAGYAQDIPEADTVDAAVLPISPRILILGPSSPGTAAIAGYLQDMLGGDPAFQSPVVQGQAIETGDPTSILSGVSLMYFFYAPDGRDTRLAAFASPWDYVVLLDSPAFAIAYPELHFEGVRTLAGLARGAGARPVVLMTWSDVDDTAARGEVAYRVANGTGAIAVPAGYAWAAARADHVQPAGRDVFVAAASVYSAMTGRDAAGTGAHPEGFAAGEVAALTGHALDAVASEAGRTHYASPYDGVVQRRSLQAGGDFWYMDSGTSSEAAWHGLMAQVLARDGWTPQGTSIGYTNPSKTFDSACQASAQPSFAARQYLLLFARDYSVGADAIRASGGQPDLQAQVWDRHADNIPVDGLEAVGMMEYKLTTWYDEAKSLGLALIPYHLMFSKLKTANSTLMLTSDGTHATDTVNWGLVTMSIVSRTGSATYTGDLDSNSQLASQLGDETIRQLSTLSEDGTYVPDDPAARPAFP